MSTSRRKKFILKRKKKRRKRILISILFLVIVFTIGFIFLNKQNNKKLASNKLTNNDKNVEENFTKNNKTNNDNNIKKHQPKEVLISSAGDCTIGADLSQTLWNTFFSVFEKQNNDYSYFFKNVLPYFSEDNYTTVNLETTFTNSTDKAPYKYFNFKAPPEYVKILSEGSIEGVNIENNHTFDYKQKGFDDTLKTLENEKIDYFGDTFKLIKEIEGTKFGFLGYKAWAMPVNFKEKLERDIKELKSQNCIIIINIHWGTENNYNPEPYQKQIAHFAIDNGADIILGHHPHVIQGIEQYKGKFICYSLGNFCFGGHNNPKDKDTFILQHKYTFDENNQLNITIKVIPCTVSSIQNLNDYCPTPITLQEEKERFFNKLNKLSPNAGYTINDDFN